MTSLKRRFMHKVRLCVGATTVSLASFAALPALAGASLPATPTYGPASTPALAESTTVVSPGGADTLYFTSAKRGERFTISIQGLLLGHATANALGRFTLTVTIPSSLPFGHYLIDAVGNKGDVLSVPINVVGQAPAVVVSTGPSTATSGFLATTGVDATATAGVGATAIILGAFLVLGARRRRKSARRDRVTL